MFNGVPFGSSRWIMADRHGQPQCVSEFLLNVLFENSTARAIGPSSIRFDEQGRCARKAHWHFSPTPVHPVIDGKFWGICASSNIDRSNIMLRVIDAIGNGSTFSVIFEIMDVDSLGLLAPDSPSILEVAHPFFLLGIQADGWLSSRLMGCPLLLDMDKLSIALWLALAFVFLDIQPQVIAALLQ